MKTFGKYDILEEIGKGGFATVYRARDRDLDREVALKVLDRTLMGNPVWVRYFREEARAIAKFSHPRIVTIHDIGEIEGSLFIVMELIEGGSLAELLKRRGPFSWERVVEIMVQIADALDYAHSHDVVHGDLKPDNVLVSPETGAVLADFGFARIFSSVTLPLSDGVVGTPEYMAPEVWDNKKVGPEADIYAMGCILYEMVTGEVLFSGKSVPAVMRAHFKPRAFPETWTEGVPPGLTEVLERALAIDPAQRYATAGELVKDLAAGDLNATKLAIINRTGGAGGVIAGREVGHHAPGPDSQSSGASPSPASKESGGGLGRKVWLAAGVVALILVTAFFVFKRSGANSSLTLTPVVAEHSILTTDTPAYPTATSVPTATPLPPCPTPTLSPTPTQTPTETPTLTPTITPTPKPDAVVNAERLRLRKGPGTEYSVIHSYPKGSPVQIIGKSSQDNWILVKTPDGKMGWMTEQLLIVNKPLAGVPEMTFVISSAFDALNAHLDPDDTLILREKTEKGARLLLLKHDSPPVILFETPSDVALLSVAPDKSFIAIAVTSSPNDTLKRDVSYVRFLQGKSINVRVISSDGKKNRSVLMGLTRVAAHYSPDGSLLLASVGTDTVAYFRANKDGSNVEKIYDGDK